MKFVSTSVELSQISFKENELFSYLNSTENETVSLEERTISGQRLLCLKLVTNILLAIFLLSSFRVETTVIWTNEKKSVPWTYFW